MKYENIIYDFTAKTPKSSLKSRIKTAE